MKTSRSFKSLRLSVTPYCNFSCHYCTPPTPVNGAPIGPEVDTLLAWVQGIHHETQLTEVRLTGGEPLLYRQLPELIEGLKNTIGIATVNLTTNGVRLNTQSSSLAQAGLDSVNVSLDALDRAAFIKCAGRDAVDDVVTGIDTALATGLQVKLNTTVMNGLNDREIIPLLKFANARHLTIRYLELMQMGHLYTVDILKQQMSAAQILEEIGSYTAISALPRVPHSTAHYWRTHEGQIFGIIGNTSLPFCHDCDRLRLDANGRIYGCLSNPTGFNYGQNPQRIREYLDHAMAQKQSEKFTGSRLSMQAIGG